MDRARGTEESWRLTLQNSPIGMGLVGADGSFLVVNRALCAMLGYEPDRLRSLCFQDITHPDDLATSLTALKEVLAGEIDVVRLRKRYLRADGVALWVDVSAAPARDAEGTLLHFVTQFLDVTEQQAAAEQLVVANRDLDLERRTLEAIFDTVDVGLLLLAPDGSYQRMNRRHAETMKLPYPQGHHGRAGRCLRPRRPDAAGPRGAAVLPGHARRGVRRRPGVGRRRTGPPNGVLGLCPQGPRPHR